MLYTTVYNISEEDNTDGVLIKLTIVLLDSYVSFEMIAHLLL